MPRNNHNGNFIKNLKKRAKKDKSPLLASWTKRWIKSSLMFLVAIILILSAPFLKKAGYVGEIFFKISNFLIGDAFYALPFFFVLSGIIFLKATKQARDSVLFLAIGIFTLAISGFLGIKDLNVKNGGLIGFLSAKLFISLFGPLVANLIFILFSLIGFFIFIQFVRQSIPFQPKEKEETVTPLFSKSTPKSLSENLKIKGIENNQEGKKSIFSSTKITLFHRGEKTKEKEEKDKEKKESKLSEKRSKDLYILPPLDLLNKEEALPTSGNIKENSLIIKNTLENFGIPVEMVEVNIGPTVTQYAFKPAEGVKLSKITTLANNLALALAAHPIRIEAPIPGKSLVGIEVPNKVRAIVALRNLLSQSSFQNSQSPLLIALGRNVSGSPVYTDITEAPHMLVAGATGTGKTIFLNALIISLLYRCTPQQLRMIMVDPKRVEFQHYNNIPHLLCPVIFDASKTINALQWLVKEMERRFRVFSEIPARNLASYNQNKKVIASGTQLPYIVFIVDELADLMAAKGREIEAGVVRLAQMARATGIHLVLATQRPSVEVITGLIKANIPTRVTFQVASQVDSRTVLDISGAEKLLGAGDMLFLSSKSAKTTRIQAPYVSEREVKRVTDFIALQREKVQESQESLVQDLKEALENPELIQIGEFESVEKEDPLYEKVKDFVLQTKKASASFLQRRFRIGYARAARLIDMLEEQGIVGPAEGAKPREVYTQKADLSSNLSIGLDEDEEEKNNEEEKWIKV